MRDCKHVFLYVFLNLQNMYFYLLSLQPVAVLDQGDPVSEIQVEVGEGAVLQAECPQS